MWPSRGGQSRRGVGRIRKKNERGLPARVLGAAMAEGIWGDFHGIGRFEGLTNEQNKSVWGERERERQKERLREEKH